VSKKIKNPSPLAIPQFFPSASSGREPVERNLQSSIFNSIPYPVNPARCDAHRGELSRLKKSA
jgi:hypothetical protein